MVDDQTTAAAAAAAASTAGKDDGGNGKKKGKKSKDKQAEPPLTPVERLQSLNLVTRMTTELSTHLGLSDRTLSEFIISLTEKELKSFLKKGGIGGTVSSSPTAAAEAVGNDVELAQAFRSTLATNGAELPLGFVSNLLRTVMEMSPRMKRYADGLEKKRLKKLQRQGSGGGAGGSGGGAGGGGAGASAPLLSSYGHTGRKAELGGAFPGLAVGNLSRSVPLDNGFYDHNEQGPRPTSGRNDGGGSDLKKPAQAAEAEVKETSRRGQSNLPAWMTRDQPAGNDGGDGPPASKRARMSSAPEIHQIYRGRVQNLMDFGVFVEFTLPDGITKKEGMVHIGQVSKTKIGHPREAGLSRGSDCWVKVISVGSGSGQTSEGGKIMLSLKDVDQKTGRDLMPHRAAAASDVGVGGSLGKADRSASGTGTHASSSASAAVVHPGLDVEALRRREAEDEAARGVDNTYLAPAARASAGGGGGGGTAVRRAKQLTEQELYEAQQLIRSGVLPVEQYPTFDSEGGMGMLAVEQTEEETEVELADIEPAFLKGQTRRSGRDFSPVRIVKNPDGSLQRAAMQQSTLAKERRELRQAQANQ